MERHEIRIARQGDCEKLDELLNNLIIYEKLFDNNINENFLVDSYFKNIISNDKYVILVVEIDNKIVGMLNSFEIDRGKAILDRVQKIDSIYVEEPYRGMKIGSQLIERLKNICKKKGIKIIEITVYNDNINAVNTYIKQGFKENRSIMGIKL